MPDREKVMRGLEAHANPTTCETCSGEECPYYHRGGSYPKVTCSSILVADALAPLKEQEPRVMTLEEVIAMPEGAVVWMEEEAESGTYIQPIVSTGNGCLGNFYTGVGTYGIDSEKRRFWTSRPSEQQMRETPWEGDSDAE